MTDSVEITRAVAGKARPRPQAERGESRSMVGTLIGRYLVLSVLGAGTMGIVYQVYDPELDRQAALKLLRNYGDDQQLAQTRLRREAQALAKLNHGNVVTVYDVGVHAGQVFVAMEFVEGQTLTRWLGLGAEARTERSWRELLAVFVAAGRGLAAAHQVGLIHRDFKPDNVMIGDDRRVCVMDFGLARRGNKKGEEEIEPTLDAGVNRAISASTSGALDLVLTRTGSAMGTPAYMAAEQFRGLDVTARSDQFGFCVALYEALYGQKPFAGADYESLAEAVLRGELRPPPTRRGIPTWLAKVIARGLARDPAERHASMEALLAELEAGEARRRRRWVGAGALAAGLCAVTVLAWQRWELDQRVAACEAAGEAITEVWNADSRASLRAGLESTELSYATATADRVEGWLERQVQQWREHATTACARETIEESWDSQTAAKARWCLEDRRVEIEALVSAFAKGQAQSVSVAVTAASGLSSVSSCVDPGVLEHMLAPPEPVKWPELGDARRELFEAEYHTLFTNFDAAEVLVSGVEAKAEALAWPPLIAAARYRRAAVLEQSGDYEGAETLAFEAYRQAVEVEAWDVAADAAISLAQLTGVRGAKPELGELWLEHAALASHHHGELGVFREAKSLSVRAALAYGKSEIAEAKALFEEILALLERELGPEHPDIAKVLNNLGVMAYASMDYERAITFYERSVTLSVKVLGPEHPKSAVALSNLANIHLTQGQPHRAKPLYERATSIQAAALGPDHADLGLGLSNLANCQVALGELEQGLATYQRTLDIRERAFGPDHPEVAWSLTGIAGILSETGRQAEATPLFARALEIREVSLEPDHMHLGESLANLGANLVALGEIERALPYLERGYEVLSSEANPPFMRGLGEFTLAEGLSLAPSAGEAELARASELAKAAREHYEAVTPSPSSSRRSRAGSVSMKMAELGRGGRSTPGPLAARVRVARPAAVRVRARDRGDLEPRSDAELLRNLD